MILLLLACLTPESFLAEYSRITCENLTRCGVEMGVSSVATDMDDCLVKMDAVHPTVCRPTHFDAESAQSCLAYLGDAYRLAMHRVERGQWPIYERTRNRNAFVPGLRLCVYIAGSGASGGLIVATATVRRVRPWRSGAALDPSAYATEVPHLVVELGDAGLLPTPVRFKDVLPRLSFAPADLSRWGPLLQGGSRRLSQEDWELMLPVSAVTPSP
jgi:hypothetical protein